MSARPRPLSPHLTTYRWEIGMSLSILHRITGVILAVGLLAFSYWLISLAAGEESYRSAVRLLASPLGLLFLLGWTFSFLFHLFNGLRHLCWDVGIGFGRTQRHASGWVAVLAAICATLTVWALLWHGGRL
jgi:succinate dehydrogenase / fumarate reductase, cytochrome b subunit